MSLPGGLSINLQLAVRIFSKFYLVATLQAAAAVAGRMLHVAVAVAAAVARCEVCVVKVTARINFH